MKVGCIGEAMIELSVDDDIAKLGVAGDTMNTAVYLARAGTCHVSYVTRLGEDAFSDRIAAFIQSEGVDTSTITRDPNRSPGLYAISVDPEGERSFTYWRDRAAARQMFGPDDDLTFEVIKGFDLVYVSAITLAILSPAARAGLFDALKAYRATGGRLAFDSNYRPKLWEDEATAQQAVAQAWRLCDIAMPSVDDEMALFGDQDQTAVLARLKSYGIKQGALKCGPEGPVSLGEPVEQIYAPASRVVDTTAAGDSFNGGYLGAILGGSDQATALMAGHECARAVVGVKGAIIPQSV